MSDYSEYGDKASGKSGGKHSKGGGSKHSKPAPGGDQGQAGGSSGCMVVAPLPVALLGMVVAALIRRRR